MVVYYIAFICSYLPGSRSDISAPGAVLGLGWFLLHVMAFILILQLMDLGVVIRCHRPATHIFCYFPAGTFLYRSYSHIRK